MTSNAMSNDKTTFLVTGSRGFVGKSIVARLLHQGHHVLGLVRSAPNAEVKGHMNGSTFREVTFDNLSTELLRNPISVIIHNAAKSSAWGPKREFVRDNIQLTKKLTEFAIDNNITKFVYISTASLYTDLKDQFDIKESRHRPLELNHYIRTKRLAEDFLLELFDESKIDIVILRPQAVLGIGDPSILPRFLELAKKGIFPRLRSSVLTSVTSVENLADAVYRSILYVSSPNYAKLRNSLPEPIFNISDSTPVQLYETVSQILSQIGLKTREFYIPGSIALVLGRFLELMTPEKWKEPALTRYKVNVLSHSRTLNIDRARAYLNYNPKISTDETLRQIIQFHLKKKRSPTTV